MDLPLIFASAALVYSSTALWLILGGDRLVSHCGRFFSLTSIASGLGGLMMGLFGYLV